MPVLCIDALPEAFCVNTLLGALDNAPGEHRELIQVERLLVRCQRCSEWHHGCGRYDREEWIRVMIDPERMCEAQK